MATRRRSSNKTITGTITDLQRRVRYLQANTPPSRLANQVVARANVRPRAIDSDQIALAAITNDQVAADAIKQANLDSNSVGENELIDGSVKEAKIDANAVTNSKIQDLAVSTTKLANASVTEQKITTSAVTQDKIRDGAVARSKIQNSAVGTNQLDNSSVTTGKLSDSSVSTGKLADSSVTSAKIGGGAVGTSKLATGSVTTDKLATGAVTGPKISSNAVTSDKIPDATRQIIVSTGLSVGAGIRKSSNTISADFGYGSTQIPRGSHVHNAVMGGSNRNGNLLGVSIALASHTHSTNITRGEDSSLRYKKEISDYIIEDPKKILLLRPKKYKYKNSSRALHETTGREWFHGYIAEEAEELGFTELISYDSEGRPDAINYAKMSLLLLELVREQQKEIDEIKDILYRRDS